MEAEGVALRERVERLSAMGFLEVTGRVPRHLRLYRTLRRDARRGRYRLAILIDYPGFHLRLGPALRRAGVPVLYYIAPQLWAWRPGRLERLRRAADRLAVILPFEQAWFAARGLPSQFVGHPLLDRRWPGREESRALLQVPASDPVLGIFPGSREREIERHWRLFRQVAHRLLAEGACSQVVAAGTAGGYYPDPGAIRVHRGAPEAVLAAATAALVKSGTATLEAALSGTPMVVAYRTARSTYAIARSLMTVDRISLVNLVAGTELVPEFWRPPVRAMPIADALRPLLREDSPERSAQAAGLAGVRHALGEPGAAARAAELALSLLSA
jgi:lipid-A-disaccharide synthase